MVSRDQVIRWGCAIVTFRLTLRDAVVPAGGAVYQEMSGGRYVPQTSRSASHTSPTVAWAASALTERNQDVLRARGGPLQVADRAAPLRTVAGRAQLRQPFRLLFFDGRVVPQRLVAGPRPRK